MAQAIEGHRVSQAFTVDSGSGTLQGGAGKSPEELWLSSNLSTERSLAGRGAPKLEEDFQGGPKAILRTWHLRFGRPVDVESRD